jgi:hypothetical protein
MSCHISYHQLYLILVALWVLIVPAFDDVFHLAMPSDSAKMLTNKELATFQKDVDVCLHEMSSLHALCSYRLLVSFVQPSENEQALNKLGGLLGLEVGLQTKFTTGLKGQFRARKERYGKNEVSDHLVASVVWWSMI